MPGLIGLSPLTTAHPSIFQHTTVRASTKYYLRFALAMVSSLWLRVLMNETKSRVSHSVSLRLLRLWRINLAASINSPDHYAKGTPSDISLACASDIVLRPPVGSWFQVLFHSPNRGSFKLSLTVLVHYRSPISI